MIRPRQPGPNARQAAGPSAASCRAGLCAFVAPFSAGDGLKASRQTLPTKGLSREQFPLNRGPTEVYSASTLETTARSLQPMPLSARPSVEPLEPRTLMSADLAVDRSR